MSRWPCNCYLAKRHNMVFVYTKHFYILSETFINKNIKCITLKQRRCKVEVIRVCQYNVHVYVHKIVNQLNDINICPQTDFVRLRPLRGIWLGLCAPGAQLSQLAGTALQDPPLWRSSWGHRGRVNICSVSCPRARNPFSHFLVCLGK